MNTNRPNQILIKKPSRNWLKPLSLLCSYLLATGSFMAEMPLNGQEEEDIYELDVFEITGSFSGSLAMAAEKKQMTPLVVEVITAEDIGKLPDTSIAESLGRLPGVTTQRINGRSQIISIRGLNEDFSAATLNGREQVTTGSVRAVEFDQYPAELISGAMVYKTGDASIVTQGIAGVVDLRSVKPLAFGRKATQIGSAYEWTAFDALVGGTERGGMRFNASYIDQFMDDKVGIAVGYAYNDKIGQGKQWNSWGFADWTDPENGENYLVIGGAKPFVRSSELERHGFASTLEYKPNEYLHSTVDVYYTKFQEDQRLVGVEFPLVVWGSAHVADYSATDGVITSGTLTDVRGVIRNDIVSRDADIYNIGWNLKLSNLDGWDLNMDLSHSMIEREDLVLESYSAITTANPYYHTMAFEQSDRGILFSPSISYANAEDVVLRHADWGSGNVDPTGLGSSKIGYMKSPESKDELYQAKLVTKREGSFFWNTVTCIEFGANYTARTKFDHENGYYILPSSGAYETAIPVQTSVTDLSFIGIDGVVTYNPVAVLDSGVFERVQNLNDDVMTSDWDAEENVTTLYSKLEIESLLKHTPINGALGFQFVNTEQSSSGFQATGTGNEGTLVRETVEGSANYWDFIPSLSLNLNLSERSYLRFSAARQIARQRMDNMRAGTEFGYDASRALSTDIENSPWSGSGGNPELEPWRANAVDLSFEHYFKDSMGYTAVSVFYKNLLSYTYQQNTLTDFSDFAAAVQGEDPLLWQGYVNRWTNGDGGELYGVELTVSLPGELVSDYLEGFGLIVSGSYTESSISQSQGGDTPLPGLSDKVFNGTLYYEKAGFSARISASYRSEYLATLDVFGPRNRSFRTASEETVIDAQVGYQFTSGMLEGFNVYFQAYNLTNEPLSTYLDGDTLRVKDYQEYGRSYAIGASYKF